MTRPTKTWLVWKARVSRKKRAAITASKAPGYGFEAWDDGTALVLVDRHPMDFGLIWVFMTLHRYFKDIK